MKTCFSLETLALPVKIEQADNGTFRVTCGGSVKSGLTYRQASAEFGRVVFKVLEADGRLVECEVQPAPEVASEVLVRELKNARNFIRSLLDAQPEEAVDFLTNNGEAVEESIKVALSEAEDRT